MEQRKIEPELLDLVDLANGTPKKQRNRPDTNSPRIRSFLDDKGASFRKWYFRACSLGREVRPKAGRPRKAEAVTNSTRWDPPDPESTKIDPKWL